MEPSHKRTALSIALTFGIAEGSSYMWWPLMPLYMLHIGVRSEAEAVYWVALGLSALGLMRLVAGPVWGLLADRFGRKFMYLRGLWFMSLTTFLMALIVEPWQAVAILALHGVSSGLDGPAVALTSVSVPEADLKRSLGWVASAKYLGQAASPALGALLALAVGYRTMTFVAAALTIAVAIAVHYAVPQDRRFGASHDPGAPEPPAARFRPTTQLWLAILLYGALSILIQILRLDTPIALKAITRDDAMGAAGMAFTIGGLASAIGVFFVSARFFRLGRLRPSLAVCTVLTGFSCLLLAASHTVALYVSAFALASLLLAAMIPTTNTLIALNAPPARRGTAFGISSGAGALAVIAGPMLGALIVATSFQAGFILVALSCLVLAAAIALTLREPQIGRDARRPEPKSA